MAIKVMEIEFTEEINPIRQLELYEGVRILVCYRGRPRGWAYVSNNPWEQTISADRVTNNCGSVRQRVGAIDFKRGVRRCF